MHSVCKLNTSRILCIILASLTGCATTAELDELRTEVEKANAIAVRAAADLARTKRELAALKAAQAAVEPSSVPALEGGTAPVTRPHGYKWGPQTPD